MLRNRFLLLGACVVVAWAAPARAEDINDPPWDMSLPNQTSQAWEISGTDTSPPIPLPPIGEPVAPTEADNPYGEPTVTLGGEWDTEVIDGPRGGPIETWHVGPGGGTITIVIPNSPEPNPIKKVFWQITSDKSPSDAVRPPQVSPAGTTGPGPYPSVQWPTGTWYTYSGVAEIQPNPSSETITFDLLECTNVSEIVVDTICTIPEPASMGLLGLGGLALLRRRRR